MQAHAPSSYIVAKQTHGMYEESRVLPTSDPRFVELKALTNEACRVVPLPPGATGVGVVARLAGGAP